MRSHLFQHTEPEGEPGSFQLANPRMLKVDLAGSGGFFYAKQGSMVAYQGDVDFAYEGSGSVSKLFKKAFTGEGMSLMKVSGRGDVFLAQDADEVFVLFLENESVTVSGDNILAFESSLAWDINRVQGASMLTGGLFNTTFTGSGALAVTAYGTPIVLDVDEPTFVDMQSAVLWSTSLTSSVRKTAKMGAVIGRGSGEAYQLGLSGQGFVVVQASEGHPLPNQNG
ncbi:AIM24 family protein [Isoptericola sp. b408]|uniref:AIM24 family protein n=1 Tax=Isoptericola sp. b408 TaxID=3064653 RepID=UPI002712E38C|nr:AIM24 family protein [Isoptericola sp. b408]MDO8150532.1 AIM24 family protein [Isoptericola sp. b408]